MFQIVSGFAPLLKTEEETPKEEGSDKCARQTLAAAVFLALTSFSRSKIATAAPERLGEARKEEKKKSTRPPPSRESFRIVYFN